MKLALRGALSGAGSAMAIAATLLVLTLVGCGPASPSVQPGTSDGGTSGAAGTVTVFAAASLKGAFSELARDFEASHQGTRVALSFAGSADLVTQISQGAPADVFASADTGNMAKLQDAGLVEGEPRNFATNTLTIAVPPGNPAGITGFRDLARAGTKVVVCGSQVPCGAAARTVEQKTGVTLNPVSEESSVTDVLGKVLSGEADAGLVYLTDAKNAGSKVGAIPFPESGQAVNTYPIARVKGSRNTQAADAFLELVLGSEGRDVLGKAGFGPAQP